MSLLYIAYELLEMQLGQDHVLRASYSGKNEFCGQSSWHNTILG